MRGAVSTFFVVGGTLAVSCVYPALDPGIQNAGDAGSGGKTGTGGVNTNSVGGSSKSTSPTVGGSSNVHSGAQSGGFASTSMGGMTSLGNTTLAGGNTMSSGGKQAATTVANAGGSSNGGTKNTGGASVASTGGATVPTGGLTATGGAASIGGTSSKGGTSSMGGPTATGATSSTGGFASTGGTSVAGGTLASGGNLPTGGTTNTGGTVGVGGAPTTGGTVATGGATATGGTVSTGGSPSTGGASPGTGGTASLLGGAPSSGGAGTGATGTLMLVQQQVLVANDGTEQDYFGQSVSVSGDTAIVGAESVNCTKQGAAYVFVQSSATWTEQQKLVAGNGAIGDCFGNSVSLSGDTVIVGAPGAPGTPTADSGVGAAYVFVRSGTTWTLQQELLASDGAIGDYFGQTVSMSGDTAIVGAIGNKWQRGAVYVFVRSGTTWALQQKLMASDAESGDMLGYSVSLSGDTAAAGAMHKNSQQGAAYVFVRSGTTWTEQQELLADDGVASDWFGMSVSVSGETAIVGAIENYGSAPGAAYVFVRSGTTWTQQQKLSASDSVANGYFGYSVALSGDVALVTAQNISSSKGGAVYVFARSGTTWAQQQKLLGSDCVAGNHFGASLALSGSTGFVGTSGKSSYQGAAYVFGP